MLILETWKRARALTLVVMGYPEFITALCRFFPLDAQGRNYASPWEEDNLTDLIGSSTLQNSGKGHAGPGPIISSQCPTVVFLPVLPMWTALV